MAGSGALVSAVASSSSTAGVVQITLANNQVSSSGPTTLSGDITRDGGADLPGLVALGATSTTSANISNGRFYYTYSNFAVAFSITTSTFKTFGRALWSRFYSSNSARNNRIDSGSGFLALAGGYYTDQNYGFSGTATSARGLTAVTFTDARINGGAPTSGFVEVLATNTSVTNHTVRFLRTIFSDTSTAAPSGVATGVPYREFDPTVYAQRTQLSNKIKKLKKKAKKLKKEKNKAKSKKLKKKAKKLSKRLKAIA